MTINIEEINIMKNKLNVFSYQNNIHEKASKLAKLAN